MKRMQLKAKPLVGIFGLVLMLCLTLFGGHERSAIAQSSGSKVCSAIVGGNWRDSFSVPSSWNEGTCSGFARSVNAETYQLGCLLDTGVSWGDGGASRPRIDCGW
jgi:hypothetical protein